MLQAYEDAQNRHFARPSMSALGQKQTFTDLSAMSALPQKADVR